MYPLGVNTILRVGKFPIIFKTNTNIQVNGLINKLVDEGQINFPKQNVIEDKIRTDYTKIENDIPYKKIPINKTVKLTENYEWRNPTEQEAMYLQKNINVLTYFPIVDIVDIPDKLGKYWVRANHDELAGLRPYHPDYQLIQQNGYKTLRLSSMAAKDDVIKLDFIPHVLTYRFEILNKLPALELPILIEFIRHDRRFEYYHQYVNGGYYKALEAYQEIKHNYKSGTHPFFFNLGRLVDSSFYRTTSLESGIFWSQRAPSEEYANEHNRKLLAQGLTWNVINTGLYNVEEPRLLKKQRFMYDFIYPREYGLKGIKFHDVVHSYTIDSFTKPTGKGEVIYDRFRVQLAYPMNSTMEITKEPTSWAFNKSRYVLKTAAGWVNSGSDKWGNSPIAEGGQITPSLPPGMELILARRAVAANTGSDKWLGYWFLFKWPFGNKVGVRMTRKPTTTLLRENVADPNFKVEIMYNPRGYEDTYPNIAIILKDYNPASVSRASTHRNSKNRWSIYIHPVDFEIELYLK